MISTRRLTTEEFILKSKEAHGDKYDYSLVEYINNRIKVKIIYEGVVYEQLPMNHLKGFKCENVKKLTQEEFIKKSILIHGDKYDYSILEFVNVRSKVKFMKDGEIYEQFAYAHLQGKSPENLPSRITTDEFIRMSMEIHGDIFDYSLVEYDIDKNKVRLIHNGKTYRQSVRDHLRGHLPRGIFKESKGIRDITNYLENNNIKYLREYYYEDCKNINYLRFDFYLIEHGVLIEYDGQQHFKSIEHWGGEEEFKKRIINDNIKDEYCKKNRIPLLRISYLEDINTKLESYIIMNCT